MKAITIIQPWATLISLGEKKFETRSWPTKHRGLIAIHAGKKVNKEVCKEEPFHSVLAKHGYTADNLPTGMILATCKLNDCWMVGNTQGNSAIVESGSCKRAVTGNDYSFGWYDRGRYAWELADIKMIYDPVPAKGQQGLWNWDGRH
ncbi:ASCH domain-containing protein [Paenibacillus radicis (ex Xue et al. 2023)]|uniref:ASCH domain-containing protein n=1 Tax=Paenibacillus radicis (ex Xue et al. 2023) TaxID=2972489 RepID=A0ABT1YJW0_9BACL|nr:ASCH domain-containing protein [Paenibacillus radicis (ex Xue et al. 2023)]MCR8633469.1 ASCH domain-containing protein [Paenibacillus radicis (ex Xue et al. 2023)]